MTTADLKQMVNQTLAGEQLSLKLMCIHINWAIDEINANMNTCFPAITSTDTEYTAIPDKYIRSTVVPGAAHHYFMVDDEGSTSETNFAQQFERGVFNMLRDYSCSVPDEYQNTDENAGSVVSSYEDSWGLRGIWL